MAVNLAEIGPGWASSISEYSWVSIHSLQGLWKFVVRCASNSRVPLNEQTSCACSFLLDWLGNLSAVFKIVNNMTTRRRTLSEVIEVHDCAKIPKERGHQIYISTLHCCELADLFLAACFLDIIDSFPRCHCCFDCPWWNEGSEVSGKVCLKLERDEFWRPTWQIRMDADRHPFLITREAQDCVTRGRNPGVIFKHSPSLIVRVGR